MARARPRQSVIDAALEGLASIDPVSMARFNPPREGYCFTHKTWCGTDPATLVATKAKAVDPANAELGEVHCSYHQGRPCVHCHKIPRTEPKHYMVGDKVEHVCSNCYSALTKTLPRKPAKGTAALSPIGKRATAGPRS